MIRFCRKTIIGRLARSIVVIAPGFAEGWNKRATVHYLLGNYHKSLTDIAETLALEEEALAFDSFEAALEIYPLAHGARHNAEALRDRLGRRDI